MTKNESPQTPLDLIYAFGLGDPELRKLKANPKLRRRAMDMMEQERPERAAIMLRRAGII